MADYSFDIVSKVDLNVISEAVSAANKEITNRYDFKGTHSTIELNQRITNSTWAPVTNTR